MLLPEGDERSFNAWAPRVMTNAYVRAPCTGVKVIEWELAPSLAGVRSTTRSRSERLSGLHRGQASTAGSRSHRVPVQIVDEEQAPALEGDEGDEEQRERGRDGHMTASTPTGASRAWTGTAGAAKEGASDRASSLY